MFKSIFSKKHTPDEAQEENKHIREKISQMNLTDMRAYLNNRITSLSVCEFGLSELMKKLIVADATSGDRYIKIDDMDTKIKKAFDLVILIATNTKITILSVEYIQEFITVYDEIIQSFDKRNKQIYGSKLNDAFELAIQGVHKKEELKKKMNILR